MSKSYFKPVEHKHVSRLINHGPTILITSFNQNSDENNIMAAAWSMPVEFTPPRIAIVVDKSTHTRKLIENSGVFGIIIPTVTTLNLTYAVGSTSGKDIDKFKEFNITYNKSPLLGVPIIENGCAAWLECKLLPELDAAQKYDTLFGEVLSASADERVFKNGHWEFNENNRSLSTIHHLGGGNFVTCGSTITAKPIA